MLNYQRVSLNCLSKTPPKPSSHAWTVQPCSTPTIPRPVPPGQCSEQLCQPATVAQKRQNFQNRRVLVALPPYLAHPGLCCWAAAARTIEVEGPQSNLGFLRGAITMQRTTRKEKDKETSVWQFDHQEKTSESSRNFQELSDPKREAYWWFSRLRILNQSSLLSSVSLMEESKNQAKPWDKNMNKLLMKRRPAGHWRLHGLIASANEGFYDRGSKPQIIHSTVLFIKKPSILEQPSCQGSPAGRQSTEGVSHHHDRKAVATGGTASTTEVWGQIEVAVGEQGATGGKQQTGGEFQGPAHLEDSPDFIRLGLKNNPRPSERFFLGPKNQYKLAKL